MAVRICFSTIILVSILYLKECRVLLAVVLSLTSLPLYGLIPLIYPGLWRDDEFILTLHVYIGII
jgi:hypothetical protein